ncbi:Mitochondrial chaperone BCS1 [Tetrabaena socialis]|uniref:Mitochondrial chaperone BCS1 n=1 Tax=Tetrabaena socialis TaxID=47790 RepID=A0A2J7ZP03_9CHLO|nr:Mitochondrial chaperone BCS1 [Tetrabaena socialis]|eukprot:PNH01997.1 Mitochondrial chaperone BCS1 [Tetrabaena socialis]
MIKAQVTLLGDTVGLFNNPAQLTVLRIEVSSHRGVITRILEEAKEEYAKVFRTADGIAVHFTRKYGEDVEWRLFGSLPYRGMDTVSLSNNLGAEIMADIQKFIADEAVYTRIGRPYKRVYCLHGPPGTGKTSLVMAVASELRRPLAIFNVDSLRDDTFIELITTRPPNSILLFEDVDVLFKVSDQKDQKGNGGMTLSTLLNTLDGVLHPSGALVFLTTNHIERLDSALRRPGRLDYVAEIGYSTPTQRIAMWHTIFPLEKAPPILNREDIRDMTPAWLSGLDTVSLPNNLGAEIMADIQKFIADEAVYTRIGRPYKRVYCLHGPPGTGKTSLVMAVASELRRPLAIFNVDSLRDDTFIELITKRPPNSILLFEDVDVLFKVSNQKGNGGMTLSTLLNTLDGVLHPSGALVFLTTNHIERLDSALRRPGRLDYVAEIGYSTPTQRIAMWHTIFPLEKAPSILSRKDIRDMTPAWLSSTLFDLRDEPPEVAALELTQAIGEKK